MLLCLPILGKAQNNGQSSESSSLRIELNGTTLDYRAIIKITNKQTCASDVKIEHNNTSITKNIPALESDTIQITLPECNIKVKPLTNCNVNADMGWVELDVCQALPIRFEWVKNKVIDKHTIQIQFKLEETDGTELYIQTSTDGVHFKRVLLVTKDMKVNQIYTVIIKL